MVMVTFNPYANYTCGIVLNMEERNAAYYLMEEWGGYMTTNTQ
jgi:hypothetical protein